MPSEPRPGEHPSLWTIGAQPAGGTADARLADIWQECSEKHAQLNARKATVEGLSTMLHEVCSDILENGINAEKIHQTHQLETGLIQARRQLAQAQQQFEAAIRQGRLAAARQLGASD